MIIKDAFIAIEDLQLAYVCYEIKKVNDNGEVEEKEWKVGLVFRNNCEKYLECENRKEAKSIVVFIQQKYQDFNKVSDNEDNKFKEWKGPYEPDSIDENAPQVANDEE